MKQKEYSINQLELASKLQYWKSLEASLSWLRGPYKSSSSELYFNNEGAYFTETVFELSPWHLSLV